MKIAVFLFIVSMSLYIISCAGSVPMPTSAHAEWASRKWGATDTLTLQQGRQLYIAKCSGCHNLHQPTEYTEMKWDKIMIKMQPKAKITNDESQLILRYLVSISEHTAETHHTASQ